MTPITWQINQTNSCGIQCEQKSRLCHGARARRMVHRTNTINRHKHTKSFNANRVDDSGPGAWRALAPDYKSPNRSIRLPIFIDHNTVDMRSGVVIVDGYVRQTVSSCVVLAAHVFHNYVLGSKHCFDVANESNARFIHCHQIRRTACPTPAQLFAHQFVVDTKAHTCRTKCQGMSQGC